LRSLEERKKTSLILVRASVRRYRIQFKYSYFQFWILNSIKKKLNSDQNQQLQFF